MSILNWTASPASLSASPADSSASQADQERADLTRLENHETRLRAEYLDHPEGYPPNWAEQLHIEVHPILEFLKAHQFTMKDFDGRKIKPDFFENFDWTNILIAGGSISRFFGNEARGDYDYDFYIYGLSPEAAKKRLIKLMSHFIRFHQKYISGLQGHLFEDVPKTPFIFTHMKVIRSRTAITLSWGRGPRNVQICLTLARDPLELLLSFDLAPCKVAFDGKKTYLLPSASYAFASKVFALSSGTLEAAGESLPARVQKYSQRGFRVVVLEPRLAKILTEAQTEVIKRTDPYYNVIDNEELTFDGPNSRVGNEFAEERIGEAYLENPTFIAMRYKIVNFFPEVGLSWDIGEPGSLWKFLDNVDAYWNHLQNSAVGSGKVWKDAPYPSLPNSIQFISLNELMKLVKARRAVLDL